MHRFPIRTLLSALFVGALLWIAAPSFVDNAWSLQVERAGLAGGLATADLASAPIAHPRLALWRGLSELARGNGAEAIAALDGAVQQSPEDTTLLLPLGRAYESTGRWDRAISVWQQAGAVVALRDLGDRLADKNMWPEASSAYLAVVTLEPGDCFYRSRAGQAIWRSMHDLPSAMLQFEHVAEVCPANLDNYIGAAYVLIEAESYAEAERWALLAVAIGTTSHRPLTVMGLSRLRQGRPAEALPFLYAAVELKPDSGEVHALLGSAYLNLGLPMKAVVELNEAMRLGPAQAWHYQSLGIAYESLGDKVRAMAYYRQALEMDPEMQAAEVRLRQLQEQ